LAENRSAGGQYDRGCDQTLDFIGPVSGNRPDPAKVGIFGKIAKLDRPVQEGDRVEIYRKITADPTTVKRRRTTRDED
jgi:hypothetical protein